jgi:hypothetical protein
MSTTAAKQHPQPPGYVTDVQILRSRDDRRKRFVAYKWGPHQRRVPLDIAAIAAGPDLWLRYVKCRCGDCREETFVSASDIAGLCPACYEKDQDEIANNPS